jgi:outer membrane lipoprotein SlyB
MQINWNAISEKIYSILKGSAKSVTMYNAKGDRTVKPSESTRFFANIPSSNKKLQNITILVACHDEGHDSHLTIKTPNVKDDKDFNKIHQIRDHIKQAICYHEGLRLKWHVFDHAINPKDEVVNNKKDSLSETITDNIKYWWNTKKQYATCKRLMKALEYEYGVKTEMIKPGSYKIIFTPDSPNTDKDMLSKELSRVFYTHYDNDGNLIVRLKTSIHEETAVNSIQESKDVSKVYGTTKSSFQQIGEAKLIIRHSDAVNENVHGARSRKIKALFVENKIGERFAYPHLHVTGARAFARHISNGGTNHDTVAQKLYSLSEDYIKLRRSANVLKLNESANPEWILRLREGMNGINRTLKKMHGPKGYKNTTASILEETSTALDEVIVLSLQTELAECCGCNKEDSMYGDLGTAAQYIASQGPMPEPITFVWKTKPDISSRTNEFSTVAERLNWQLNELANACENQNAVASLQNIAEQIANGVMPTESDLNLIRRAYESSQSFVAEEVALPEESELDEYLDNFKEENIFSEEMTDEGNAFGGALAAAKASGKKEFSVDGKKFKVNEDGSVEESSCNMTAEGEHCPVHGMEECWSTGTMAESNDDDVDEETSFATAGEIAGGVLGGAAGAALGGPPGSIAGGALGAAAGTAAGKWLDKKLAVDEVDDDLDYDEDEDENMMDEGMKQKLAAMGLAGTAALGAATGMGAHSASTPGTGWDKDSAQWAQSGLPDHVKSQTEINKVDSNKTVDKKMSSVQGPNANGEYRVTVVTRIPGQPKPTVQTYVTKDPPKDLMVKEETAENAVFEAEVLRLKNLAGI